jgi:hypothetical protein
LGKTQEGSETFRSRLRDLNELVIRILSRGIDINELTIGEIIDIETTATNRDKTNWACSAQNPDMLPKIDTPGNGKAQLTGVVNRMIQQGGYDKK